MTDSKTRFSCSSPRGTRRSRPTHSAEPPKRAGWPRRALRPVQGALYPLGATPLGGHRDDGRPQHAHHARAERARRDWVALGAT